MIVKELGVNRIGMKRSYAIIVAARDTGDLFLEGSFWRVVTTVQATTANEAAAAYGRRADAWFQFLVTDYEPALDVAHSREVKPCFS
jgi:hypothetical protein